MKTSESAQDRPRNWDIYKKLGTDIEEVENVKNDNEVPKIDENGRKCDNGTQQPTYSAQKRPENWDTYKKLGTKLGESEVGIEVCNLDENDENNEYGVEMMKCETGIRKSPKNAQACPKNWDIYEKLGILNGEIGDQTECDEKLGDVMVENVKSDQKYVSESVKEVPLENAQNCPKNWDIYKKLGIKSEGNERPLSKTPPAAGTKRFPCLEDLRHSKAVKSPEKLEQNLSLNHPPPPRLM